MIVAVGALTPVSLAVDASLPQDVNNRKAVVLKEQRVRASADLGLVRCAPECTVPGPGRIFSQVFFYSMKGENADV